MEMIPQPKTPLSASLLRIAMGWLFLWAFIDKLWGLGYATAAAKSWINGGSPTYGFLKMGAKGVFAPLFQALAGKAIIDWLFMLALLGIGVALLLGVAIRFASICGVVLVVMMWMVVLPPANNPIIDDHIIYALVFLLMAYQPLFFSRLSFYSQWLPSRFVQRMPWMK
ncbi:MAG: hypothetical protein KIH62_003770 [Candidatus Kerfeldbacteria bacterium]|nr:hypothetical protein [Candidatus Kerfeldbacteria bacterium]